MASEESSSGKTKFNDPDLVRGFATSYEQYFRFGAVANGGGAVACLAILGTTTKLGVAEKFLLVPLSVFVLGILAVWLCVFVLNCRLADRVFELEAPKKKTLFNKINDAFGPLFNNGTLLIAPLILFCLGVLLGLGAILFA